MQVATGITTFTAEEGAEFKEVDVATWELKSRHHEQPLQPTAAQVMSRHEGWCRDTRRHPFTATVHVLNVATSRPMSRHYNQQWDGSKDLS